MSDTSLSTSHDLSRQLEEALAARLATEDAGQALDLAKLSIEYPELASELLTFFELGDRITILARKLQAGEQATRSLSAAELITDAQTGSSDRPDSICDLIGGPKSTVREAAGPHASWTDPDATRSVSMKVQEEPDLLAGGTNVRYFGDYELIQVLGRGGMGVVYRARQLSLNRPVALKMLRAGMLASDDDLRRFQNEAEAVALLDHPNIVPIFEVGRYQEQRYFSMKLIDGPSLDQKLGDYFASPKAAAVLVAKVAEAVHHAHQRGILHRDLKPSNILLDERNEPHVTDFGLAKRIEGDIELTQSGAILGTPAYMAPEQASGKRGAVTTATDIYGLGAVLYALLTGHGPFTGESVAETLEQVRERTPQPPSRHNPQVPRDLEIICLKCMEKEPAQRYTSARDLADDLRRFFGGEPIFARTIGPLARALMWCRRNPLITRLMGLMLVLAFVVVVSTAAVFVVDVARRGEANARKEAEENFQMAQKAVDHYLTNVSENTLLKEQETLDIRELRRELLESALPFYKKFVKDRNHDPRIREQLANAHFRLGEITRVIGTSQDALDYYRSALEIWEPLARSAPENLEYQSRLADCYFVFGQLKQSENLPKPVMVATSGNPSAGSAMVRHSENLPESLTYLNKALAIYEKLSTESPSEPRFQSSLAACCSEMSVYFSMDKRVDESLKYLNQAQTIQQRLVDLHPDKIEYKKSLAEIVNRVGYVDYTLRDYNAALKTYQEFQRLCQEIIEEARVGPKPLRLQDLLAISYYNLASMYREQNELQQSLESSIKAEEIWSKLASSHPSVTSYQMSLGRAYWSRGWAEYRLGHHADALDSVKHDLDIFNRLSKAELDNLDYRIETASALNLKGLIYDDKRQNEQARAAFKEAVELCRSILERSKGIDDRKIDLCQSLENLGDTYLEVGDVFGGLLRLGEALRLRQELNAAHTGDRDYAMDVVDGWIAIGNIQRQDGISQEA